MHKSTARILVIDDDPDVLIAARVVLRQKFDTVMTENNHQRIAGILQREKYDVVLLDMNFAAGNSSGHEGLFWLRQILAKQPETKVILITAYADVHVAVQGMKVGACDFIVKPWENERIIKAIVDALEGKVAGTQVEIVHDVVQPVFVSPAMRALKETVDKIAPTAANVLLLGENGTGKDTLAHYIHVHSSRRSQPFLKVDIGALSVSLLESELFGHRKGAFTDATTDRVGRFEAANGGTLFLDEIGNIGVESQARLLSVLQNRSITPIGSNVQFPVDVRVISATNTRIHEAVAFGSFRQDLLYRLNTIELTVPPLRERREDIPILAKEFVTYYCDRYQKEQRTLDGNTLQHLSEYNWPGNVRELQHTIERAVILSDDTHLRKKDFKFSSYSSGAEMSGIRTLDEMEQRAILSALEKHEGNLSKVARELGLGRTTLYRKMEKYNIHK